MSDQLIPGLQAPGEDGHERLRELLPAYAIERLQGGPDSRQWQPLVRHLATCAACREELAELLLLLRETAMGADETELDLPTFDLSALPPFSGRDGSQPEAEPLRPRPPAPPRPVSPSARELLIDLGAALLQAMRGPQLAGAFRQNGGAAPGEFHHQISVDAPEPIDVDLDLTLSDQQRSFYRLQVTVLAAGDPFDQGGHAVTLRYEGHSATAVTDERGCVVFGGLPHEALGRLQISVQLGSPG